MGRSNRRNPSRSRKSRSEASTQPAANGDSDKPGGGKFIIILAGAAVLILLGAIGLWSRPTNEAPTAATAENKRHTSVPPRKLPVPPVDRPSATPIAVTEPEDLEALDPQTRAYVAAHIRAAKANPAEVSSHVTLGQVYFANGLWQEADDCFEKVLAQRPGSVMPAYYSAVATFKMGEMDEYKRMLQDLVQRVATFAPAQFRLGIIYLEEGAADEAGEAFQKVIDNKAQAPAGYIGMADVKIRQREYAEAERLLKKAFELNTQTRKAHYLLGLAYRGLGRPEEAKKELAKGSGATQQFMGDRWSTEVNKHRMGVAYQVRKAERFLKAKEPDQAIEVLEVTLKFHPENVEVLNNLSIAYMDSQRFEKALSLLTQAESIGDNATATSINLAACHLGLGSFAKALQYADRAIELGPTVAQAYLTRARTLIRMDRAEEAMSAMEHFLSLESENDSVRFDLANSYMALDRPIEAKVHYATLAEHVPNSIQAHLRLCEACIRTEDWEEAESALANAQQVAPNHDLVMRMTDRLARVRP
ncbi:MAG: tetratricopeptide repeat protein [Planctomycetes bacterium]|nr:tetratricopeptide repeat protein [Planctomycetota bacterium]